MSYLELDLNNAYVFLSGTEKVPSELHLSRLVAARLDLPVSQRLLKEGFKLSVIKRCWEDQLLLKST